MTEAGTDAEPKKPDPVTMPLSGEDAREGECSRCGDVGRVWPLEQPSDIVMEIEWGYAWLCLGCWRSMGRFIGRGGGSSDQSSTDTHQGDQA